MLDDAKRIGQEIRKAAWWWFLNYPTESVLPKSSVFGGSEALRKFNDSRTKGNDE